MAFTEDHENHQLTDEGWSRIELQFTETVDGKRRFATKYYYFDQQPITQIEETLFQMLIDIRLLRKKDPQTIIQFRVS